MSLQQRPTSFHHVADSTAPERGVDGTVDLQPDDEASLLSAERGEQFIRIRLAIHHVDRGGDIRDLRIDASDQGEPPPRFLVFQRATTSVGYARSTFPEHRFHTQYPERCTVLCGNRQGKLTDETVSLIASDPPDAIALAAEAELSAVVRDEHCSLLSTPRRRGSYVWLEDRDRRDRFISEEPVRCFEGSIRPCRLREALVGRLSQLLSDPNKPRCQSLVAELSRFDLATDVHGEGRSRTGRSAPDV